MYKIQFEIKSKMTAYVWPFLDMLCLLTDHPMSDEIDEFLTAPVVIAIDRVNKETYNCTSMVEGNILHIFHPAEIHHFTGFKPQVYHCILT